MTKELKHYAQINFHIDIFQTDDGGLIDSGSKLSESDLKQLGITNTAVLGITGDNKEDCVKKVLECLNKINYG